MLGLDFSPLRLSREFRKLFFYGIFATIGGQATYVATALQLRNLTHSTLAVGSLGLVELVPLLVFGLYGGVIADHWNRRRVVMTCEAILVLAVGLLLVNASLTHPHVWVIYVGDAFIVSAGSVQQPSLAGMSQLFVAHDQQRAAARLGSLRQTTTSIIGPALGGLLAASFGVRWAFALNLATFVFSLALLVTLAPVARVGVRRVSQLAFFREGVAYTRSRPDIVGTYIIDILAMTLAYPVVMLPFVAARFHQTWALSLLYTALPGGALVATLLGKWTHNVHRYGRAIVMAAGAWGLGVAVFGFATQLWLVFLGLAAGGAADAYSAMFRQSMWNQSIPPDVRGRLGGIEMISYAVGPMLGQFRAGAMAAWTSLRFSLSVGGLAATGSIATVGAALPSLWRFDASTDANVALVKRRREELENS